MFRAPILLLVTALFASCASTPPAASTLPEPKSFQEDVDNAVSAIDADLSSMRSEEVNDASKHVTVIAHRSAATIRKMIVIKTADDETSTTHYFFAPDETLIFVGRRGDRFLRTNGRLDTITSLDGEYYFAGSNITVPMLRDNTGIETSGGDHDILEVAVDALRLLDGNARASSPPEVMPVTDV